MEKVDTGECRPHGNNLITPALCFGHSEMTCRDSEKKKKNREHSVQPSSIFFTAKGTEPLITVTDLGGNLLFQDAGLST